MTDDAFADVYPQMLKACWSCGTFSIAFAWATVFYAVFHAAHGQSPLDQQIGLPHYDLWTLVAIYLLACLGAGLASQKLRAVDATKKYHVVLAEAVDFLPSPVFSGCLMAYLTRFEAGGKIGNALRDLLASWLIAAAVVAAPGLAERVSGRPRYYVDVVVRVMAMTCSFGLGIAWNSTISGGLEPILPLTGGVISHTIYLVVVAVIAARLAAEPPHERPIRRRQIDLLAFASKVVAAFALVSWLTVVVVFLGGPEGLTGQISVLLLLVPVEAFLSAAVAKVDLSPATIHHVDERYHCSSIAHAALFVPCVWCCCPWVFVIALLASNVDPVVVKESWLAMSSFVTGLAASIVATGLVVSLVNTVAIAAGVEEEAGAFVIVAALVAAALSAIIAYLLEPLAAQESPTATPVPSAPAGENVP
eukprot:CAMPEP_0119291296 /NCGR_PEP_ID=MMETSP1329-20130426/42217_1 /TAXON_ID=114041 /ORGANISM="Genus nov. species nov., Strain RCC1024" /LENGTH=418 /DNA_ID=CAMNT_0007292125 /DNA_START=194 /DNA_END=1446 /DNA_ORIENTATION=+